jgi:glc operon protein GlcG
MSRQPAGVFIMFTRYLSLTTLVVAGVVAGASAQTLTPTLDLSSATRLASLASAEAHARRAGGSIAVVDAGGHLLFLERLDNTFPAAAAVSTEKARTAATFRAPTRNFEEAIKNGRNALLGVGVMTPLQGGVPVMLNGAVVGAIGVSGAHSAQEDDDIAQAAVTAFATPAPASMPNGEVVHLKSDQVRSAFVKGMPLLETSGYKIHASRRDAAGQAEVHTRDTDIIYVLDGTVTFVTGGTVIDPKETGPDEIRGARIEGGRAQALNKGDVMVVPAGVPHWFRQVDETFLYYVVKATNAGDARGTR